MAEHQRYYSTNLYGTWTACHQQLMMMQLRGGVNGFSWYNDAIPSNMTCRSTTRRSSCRSSSSRT